MHWIPVCKLHHHSFPLIHFWTPKKNANFKTSTWIFFWKRCSCVLKEKIIKIKLTIIIFLFVLLTVITRNFYMLSTYYIYFSSLILPCYFTQMIQTWFIALIRCKIKALCLIWNQLPNPPICCNHRASENTADLSPSWSRKPSQISLESYLVFMFLGFYLLL